MFLQKSEFRITLRKKLEETSILNHPLFEDLTKGEGNIVLLRQASLEGYQLVKMFPRYVAALLHTCPVDKLRPLLAANLYEEETGGISNTKRHVELMEDFLESIDVKKEERKYAQPLLTTQDLIDYRWNLVINPHTFHLGAAAITIASEGQNLDKKENKFKHHFLKEIYNLKEEDVKFFSMHSTEDEAHVNEGIEIVSEVCKDENMQREVLQTIETTNKKFWNFYEGIYETYKLRNSGLQRV